MLHQSFSSETLTYDSHASRRDMQAIIDAHGPLVRRIAWHVHGRMSSAIEVEDLIQIGLVALIEAARTFEDRGIAFAPYAATRIRGAMIDSLRRDARIGRGGMADRRRLAETRDRLEQRLMRPPHDAEIAAELGLDGAAYHALLGRAQSARQESIDDHYSDHSPWFADASDNAEETLSKQELHATLAHHIALLDEREALVLQLYFVEELNLHEIGATLGIGAARVCQIKKAALGRLQEMMQVDEI